MENVDITFRGDHCNCTCSTTTDEYGWYEEQLQGCQNYAVTYESSDPTGGNGYGYPTHYRHVSGDNTYVTLDVEMKPYEATTVSSPTTSNVEVSLGTAESSDGTTDPDSFKLILKPNSLQLSGGGTPQDPLLIKHTDYNPATDSEGSFPVALEATSGSFDSTGYDASQYGSGPIPLFSFGMFDVEIEDNNGDTVELIPGETAGYEMTVDEDNQEGAAEISDFIVDFVVDKDSGLWTPGGVQAISYDPSTRQVTSDGLTSFSPHNPDGPPPRSSRSSSSISSSSSSSSSMSSTSSYSSCTSMSSVPYPTPVGYTYATALCVSGSSGVDYEGSYFYDHYSEATPYQYIATTGHNLPGNPLLELDVSSLDYESGSLELYFKAFNRGVSGGGFSDRLFVIVYSTVQLTTDQIGGTRTISYDDAVRCPRAQETYTATNSGVPAFDSQPNITKYIDKSGDINYIYVFLQKEITETTWPDYGSVQSLGSVNHPSTWGVTRDLVAGLAWRFVKNDDLQGKTWRHCTKPYEIWAQPRGNEWGFKLINTDTQAEIENVGPLFAPTPQNAAWSFTVSTDLNNPACTCSSSSYSSESNSSSSQSSSSNSSSRSSSSSDSSSSSNSSSRSSSSISTESSHSSCAACCSSNSSDTPNSSSSHSSSSSYSSSSHSSSESSSGTLCVDCDPDPSEQTLTFDLVDPHNNANNSQWTLTWDPTTCAYDGINSQGPGSVSLYFAWETGSLSMVIQHGTLGRFVTDPYNQVGASCGGFAGNVFYHESDNAFSGPTITIS